MSEQPLTPAGNGRVPGGQFAKGNKAGKGNPLNRRAQKIRSAILKASTPEDIQIIARALIDGAKSGDLQFIREYLDRTAGKATQSELLERIEAIEAAMAAQKNGRTINGN